MKARGGGSAWHREPMVWLIIMIPLSAVVMGAVMLTLAISTYDGLVSDDYYKQGLQINRSMERDALARSYALGADVLLGAAGEAIEVSLSGNLRFQSPEIVQLQLFHATRPGLDRSVAVAPCRFRALCGERPATRARSLVSATRRRWLAPQNALCRLGWFAAPDPGPH